MTAGSAYKQSSLDSAALHRCPICRNLGSTFKNPAPDKTAGYLLDQSGAKQFKEGNAAVSAIHANFVVNLGGASTGEVISLLRRMQEIVQEKHGLLLHPEWKTLGKFAAKDISEIWNGEK